MDGLQSERNNTMRKGKIFAAIAASALMLAMCGSSAAAEEDTILLMDMHVADSGNSEIEEEVMTDSYGDTYDSNVMRFDADNSGFVSYELNGEYASFSGAIVASEETPSDASITVAVYADGKNILTEECLTRQTAAKDFQVDVAGVHTLEISTRNDSGGWGGSYIYLVDASFEKAEEKAVSTETADLRDTVLVDSSSYEADRSLIKDTFGTVHNGYHKMNPGEGNAYAMFNLNQKYVSFEGGFVAGEDTDSDDIVKVEIYQDDQVVFSQDGIGKQTPQVNFSLDVTNAKTLKIVAVRQTDEELWRQNTIYLVDDVLKPHAHTPGDWEIEKEATCTEKGKKVQYCTACKEVCNIEEIDALGHKPDRKAVVETEATCEKEGQKVQHCTVCGEPCEEETIPKADHTPSEDWEIQTEATCISEGEKALTCSVCGQVLKTETIPKTDHTPSEDWFEVMPASCTQKGLSALYCTECGDEIKTKEIPAAGHQYGKWVKINGSVWNGPIMRERTCSVCYETQRDSVTTWMWVKPVVILVILAGVILAALYAMFRSKGLAFNLKNLKKLGDSYKDRPKKDSDEDDIFNKH